MVLSQFILNVTSFPSRMVTGRMTFNIFRVRSISTFRSPSQTATSHSEDSQTDLHLQSIKATGSGQAISASPFHDSHTEARHILPHCRCVTASGSPLVWGTGMDWKCLIQMPSSSRPITWNHFSHRTPQQRIDNWRFSALMPAWYARHQMSICLNHNSVCTRRKNPETST